jgi:hypothetical protein
MTNHEKFENDDDGRDRSRETQNLREMIKPVPRAVTVLDTCIDRALAAKALGDARYEQGRELRKDAQLEMSACDQFDREAETLRPTRAQRRDNEKRRERAQRDLQRANELISSPGDGPIYLVHKFAQWFQFLERDRRKLMRSAFDTAKAAKGASFPDELNAADFAPIIRVESIWPSKVPDSIEKLVLAHAKKGDRRKALVVDRKRLENSPRPAEDVAADVLREIEKRAVAPKVRQAFAYDRTQVDGRPRAQGVGWPTMYDKTLDDHVIDPVALLFWCCKDTIQKKITALLKEVAPPTGLTLAQRNEQIAAIDEELRLLEIEECALTWRLLEAGQKVAFSPDAHPAHVLGLKVTMEPRSEFDF